MSAWHLGAIRLGFGHSHRVAQGASVEMVVRDAIPVQVDGEPVPATAVIHDSAQGKIPPTLGRARAERAHRRARPETERRPNESFVMTETTSDFYGCSLQNTRRALPVSRRDVAADDAASLSFYSIRA